MNSRKPIDNNGLDAATGTESSGGAMRGNFLRAVGHTVKSHKLGDIMMASGLISQEQLDKALAHQKITGEQIGRVLIEQGMVSAAQLYRKLAEQWCLKAAAAGVALMMQTAMPSIAKAENNGLTEQFKLASAASVGHSALKEKAHYQYPALFGTHEIKSDDISAFRKWTSVMSRFEEQMKTVSSSPRVQMWKTHLQQIKGMSQTDQIAEVNDYVNQVHYIEDRDNYGKSDYWATPMEFFSRGGDCEDFAIAKFASLRALGFSADQLRIAVVQDTLKGVAHAILIVYTNDGAYVLDNQNKRVERMQAVARYVPVFSISSASWWLHKKALS